MEQGHPPPPSSCPGRWWWWRRLPTCWCRIQRRLINWDGSPCRTFALLTVTIQMIWCVAFTSYRLCCALCVSLAVMVVFLKLKDVALSTSKGAHLWRQLTASWELMDSGQDSRSSLGPEISESFRLFLQETSSFKQQNPGKFCLLVCSVCTFFAVLGRYIPGVVISYTLVLGVFLWPLISSPEFLMWLKPVLQKLDFGVGDFLHRIKEDHEKRLLQSQGEKENIEEDLSSMFPKLDSTVCKEMCVSDTDVSDVTWTDNGTFNLSEGHTPQTENSEDLDKEEAFTGGLPEFPSLDNGLSNGDDSDLSIGLPTPPPLPSSNQAPLPPPPETAEAALELVQQMASDAIAAAVTSAIQERIEAAVVAAVTSADDLPPERRSRSRPRPQEVQVTSLTPFDLAEESDSEVEDFELLDQSELEQLEEELLGGGGAAAEHKKKKAEKDVDPASSGKPPSSPSAGFFSKLLGRH